MNQFHRLQRSIAIAAVALPLFAGAARCDDAFSSRNVSLWYRSPAYTKSPAAALTKRADDLALMLEDEEAVKLYTQALALDKSFAPAYRNRGKAYGGDGKVDLAVADYRAALALTAANGDHNYHYVILRDLSDILFQARRYKEAIIIFDELCKSARAEGVMAGRGECYLNLKNYPAAIADFDRALTVKHNGYYIIRLRARAYLESKQYEKAVADSTKLLTIDKQGDASMSNNADILSMRAKAYEGLGKKDLAEKDMRMAGIRDAENLKTAPFASGKQKPAAASSW